jgi:uncharacterized membrane protein YphA (DoxX/SURF4 family)
VEVTMYNALFRDTLAPLVLRLTLAAIFIYHGLDKIQNHNLGASWAKDLWVAKRQFPADYRDVLNKMEPEEFFRTDLKEVLDRINKKNPKHPITLKALSQMVKDNIAVAWTKEATQEDLPAALDITVAQLAVAWGELLGGIALLVGLLTRLAAVGLIIIQVGAIYTVTFEKGFSAAGGIGFEYNLAIIAMCLAVFFWGAGNLSVDVLFRRKRKSA